MPWANLYRFADAEQAKSTGGMVALYPREDDAHRLAIPGGEPPEELHLTLAYLGEDVSGLDPTPIAHLVMQLAAQVTVITARIMGHALFNPDGGGDPDDPKEPCAVYLVGDTDQLPDLHEALLQGLSHVGSIPAQHKPFIPHVTAGYSLPIAALSYTGPVLFDRLGLAFGGDTHFFPLLGATVEEYSA
jgi:hypothetical protein